MTEKEKKLFNYFLDLVEFGNGDIDDSVWDGWTKKEREKFVKEYHEWNGDLEVYNKDYLHIPDFAIFNFMSYKIKNKEKLNHINLKPCPFCGEAEYLKVIREGTNKRSCQIQCESCSCKLESNEIGYGFAWNNRY